MYENQNFELGKGRNLRGASRSCVLGKEGGEGVVNFKILVVIGIENSRREGENRKKKKEKRKTQCSGFGVPKICILPFLSKTIF